MLRETLRLLEEHDNTVNLLMETQRTRIRTQLFNLSHAKILAYNTVIIQVKYIVVALLDKVETFENMKIDIELNVQEEVNVICQVKMDVRITLSNNRWRN